MNPLGLPGDWLPYIPLGLIGLFRWSSWLAKKIPSLLYRAKPPAQWTTAVSVITPVYRETPEAFRAALESWIAEEPAEIIAVIDARDSACIETFLDVARSSPVEMRMHVTEEPGKRPALALGIRVARSGVVALVDSDTIWEPGLIPAVLAPFEDGRVAGVGTRQNVRDAHNLWQRMADVVLDLRYHDEMRFLGRVGGQVTCLSGRTAVYRRDVLLPLMHEFLNETFLGAKCNSGDDKRLTYLVQQRGYRCAYQHNARVYTFAPADFSTFLQQRVRWSRNSWRADLRALTQRWTWRHPAFVWFLLDRTISPFTALIAPTIMALAIWRQHWGVAAVIAAWWLVSRTVKLWPHIKNRPADAALVPVYIPMTYFLAAIKIHALVTLNWQGWLTRGVRARFHPEKAIPTIVSISATLMLVALIGAAVLLGNTALARATTGASSTEANIVVSATDVTPPFDPVLWATTRELPATYSGDDEYLELLGERSHTVSAGESYASIALDAYGDAVFSQMIARANDADPASAPVPGDVIVLPRGGDAPARRPGAPGASAMYDEASDQIVVIGAGTAATLSSISAQLPAGLLAETSPGEWYLSVPLVITDGVHLDVVSRERGGDADWLKLRSDAGTTTSLRALNAEIYVEGARITSWDETAGDYDRELADGRAYVLAKNNSSTFPSARLDAIDAEFAFLGFGSAESYGVSWRVSTGSPRNVSGTIIGSSFHDNYFGAYTFGATDMYWGGNEFRANAVYGLDPHDDSNDFVVIYNSFSENGRHGLIFSKRCLRNLIAYNTAFDNDLHGIMLDQDSDSNLVIRNDVYDNTDGIAVFESRDNIVIQNEVRGNRHAGVRFNGASSDNAAERNVVAENIIEANAAHGVYLYGGAGRNVIQANTISGSANGIYVRSGENRLGGYLSGNTITGNGKGVVLRGETAVGNLIEGNEVSRNRDKGVALQYGAENLVRGNTLEQNGDAAVSLEGETQSVVLDNRLAGNGQSVAARQCAACRIIANNAPNGLIKLSGASLITIEDQPPGTVHFADRASRATVIGRDGSLVRLPRRHPIFSSSGGTAFQIRASKSNTRVTTSESTVQVWSGQPFSARSEERGNTTWTVAASTSFSQRVSSLEPGRQYSVTVDGRAYGQFRAGPSGVIEFTYDGDISEPITFELRAR